MRLQMQGTTTMPGSGVGARGQLAPVRLGGREATVTLSHLGQGSDTTRIRPTHPTADTTTRDRVPGTQGAATPSQPRRVAQSQYKAQALGLIRPSEASGMPLVRTDHGKPSQNRAHTWRPQLFRPQKTDWATIPVPIRWPSPRRRPIGCHRTRFGRKRS